MTNARKAELPRLHVLTDARGPHGVDLLGLARDVFAGGADGLQYRDKDATAERRRTLARALVSLARSQAPPRTLIVNDDPALAREVDADGVHVGPGDPPPDEARRVVGEERLVGFSAGTPEEARYAEERGADYLGVGAVWGSRTRDDAGEAIGLEGLHAVIGATRLPVIAIGSLTPERAEQAIAAGAHGVAVISAIAHAPDPRGATRGFLAAIEGALAARRKPA